MKMFDSAVTVMAEHLEETRSDITAAASSVRTAAIAATVALALVALVAVVALAKSSAQGAA